MKKPPLDRQQLLRRALPRPRKRPVRVFHGLGTGVVRTIEGFARVALSPLQLFSPQELTVGLFGLGAGLLGAGAVGLAGYALDRGAADVSARRRQALGLGIGYGALSSYDLNFSRFGLGDQTLSGVATGVYDVTSPQYLPLLTSGAATGDTASAAVDLMKKICPQCFRAFADQMVGPVARSRGMDRTSSIFNRLSASRMPTPKRFKGRSSATTLISARWRSPLKRKRNGRTSTRR